MRCTKDIERVKDINMESEISSFERNCKEFVRVYEDGVSET